MCFQPQLICINLGTNDFSTGGPDVDKFVAAGLFKQDPTSNLVLLQGPLNNSPELRVAVTARRKSREVSSE